MIGKQPPFSPSEPLEPRYDQDTSASILPDHPSGNVYGKPLSTLDWAAGKSQNCLKVIIVRRLVPLLVAARLAAVQNDILSASYIYRNRLHESLALGLTISRIHVNMLTP